MSPDNDIENFLVLMHLADFRGVNQRGDRVHDGGWRKTEDVKKADNPWKRADFAAKAPGRAGIFLSGARVACPKAVFRCWIQKTT
jgi:hypothetical protein